MGHGGGLLHLGSTETRTALPPVFAFWRDFARDFVAISAIDRVQSVLLVNPRRLDVSSLQQFLEVARAKPDWPNGWAPSACSRPAPRLPEPVICSPD